MPYSDNSIKVFSAAIAKLKDSLPEPAFVRLGELLGQSGLGDPAAVLDALMKDGNAQDAD